MNQQTSRNDGLKAHFKGAFLKTELRRLPKTPVFWIILGAQAFIVLVYSMILGLLYGNAQWVQDIFQSISDVLANSVISGFDFMSLSLASECKTPLDFIRLNVGPNTVLMLSIFIAVFCGAYRRSGFIKNIATRQNRTRVVFVNVVIICIMSALLNIVLIVAMLPSLGLYFEGLEKNTFGQYLLFFFGETVLTWNAGMFLYSITEAFKNVNTGLIFCVIYTSGISTYIYLLFNSIVEFATKHAFTLQRFVPMGMMTVFDVADPETWLNGLLVTLIYSELSILISLRCSRRREY